MTQLHLLSHTAGFVELAQIPEIRAIRLIMNRDVTRDSVYAIISRYAPGYGHRPTEQTLRIIPPHP